MSSRHVFWKITWESVRIRISICRRCVKRKRRVWGFRKWRLSRERLPWTIRFAVYRRNLVNVNININPQYPTMNKSLLNSKASFRHARIKTNLQFLCCSKKYQTCKHIFKKQRIRINICSMTAMKRILSIKKNLGDLRTWIKLLGTCKKYYKSANTNTKHKLTISSKKYRF